MDPREKLANIQDQKRRLKERIEHMTAIEANTQAEDPELERMLSKKKEVPINLNSLKNRRGGRPIMTSLRNSTTIGECKWKEKNSWNALKTRREASNWRSP